MEPSALSLLPALLAVVLALGTRNVLLSLFSACWLGGALVTGSVFGGLYQVIDPWLLDAVADRDHVKVTLFSLFVAAMVGILSKSGGTSAMVQVLIRVATTRRRGMVVTWLAGMVVFFDDYANCLIVGSSMRALSDKLQISREKLAYIVDSTAAPIASVALVSTWIGYEVGLMGDGLAAAGITDIDAYAFFIQGIPYRFYSLFTIVFVGAIAFSGRDFGPMLQAEENLELPQDEAESSETEHPAWRALLAIVPIGVLILVTGAVLWIDGSAGAAPGAALFEVLGNADGYNAMLKGSLAGMLVAAILSLGTRSLKLKATFDAGLDGMGSLFEALAVLFLAWSLGTAMGELQAAAYLVDLLGDSLPAAMLPTAVFVVSAATAFATGSSFGTMGIVMPIALPLSFALSDDPMIALAASGAVLSGACWGDHCSPISDTTILSSVGAGCQVSRHVKTQLPYAMLCGLVAVVLGTIPVGFGAPVWLVLPMGMVACVALVWGLGRAPKRAVSAEVVA